MTHLTREDLLELAEQARTESSAPHLASCEVCCSKLRELRAVLDAVTGVDVPEPSPLFWDHLSSRISEAVAADTAGKPAAGPWWAPVRRWRWAMAAAAGTAAVVMAAVITIGTRTGEPPAVPGNAVAGTASGAGVAGVGSGSEVQSADSAAEMRGILGLTDLADDPSLSLLADLTEELDWDGATEAGIAVGSGIADRVVDELNDDERAELQRLLNDALAGTPTGSIAAPITIAPDLSSIRLGRT